MSDNQPNTQAVIVEILKELEPYFEELEKRIEKLEDLLKKTKSNK